MRYSGTSPRKIGKITFIARPFFVFGGVLLSDLGIVARSGELFTRFKTVFSIDANVESRNTGFACECWRRAGETIIIEKMLPDHRAGPLPDQYVNNYKTQGWLADQEYSRMSVKSIVFLATGIRTNGKLWGILVLDSTDPNSGLAENARKDRETHQKHLESVALALGLLVG